MDLQEENVSSEYIMQCIRWCADTDDTKACAEHINVHGKRLVRDPKYIHELGQLLQETCIKNKSEIAALLLNGLEPEIRFQLKNTKSWCHKLFYNAIIYGNVFVVKHLIGKGADVSASFYGKPVLHIAACYGYMDVVNELMDAGANIQAVDKRGDGIIYSILTSQLPNKAEAVRTVIKFGANPLVRSSSGKLPIHLAALNCPDVLDLLLQDGHDVNTVDDVNKETPLHIACGIACQDTIVKLLQYGCKVNIANSKGETPLAKLLRFTNDVHDFHTKIRMQMAKRLIDIGFKIQFHRTVKGTNGRRDKLYDRYISLKESIKTPPSLQNMTRYTVRESLALGSGVHKCVHSLDVPLNLKSYILYHDFKF